MNTTEFLNLVKLTAMTPTSQSTFTDPEILALANDELRNKVIPLVMSVREEYFVSETDIALVADKNAYSIPARSIGLKLREVAYVDTNGNIYNLPRLDIENISGVSNTQSGNHPSGFYLRNNKVVVYPTPSNSSTGSLRLTYNRRPNSLVEESDASQITAIDTGTNTVTVSLITNSAMIAGGKIDFIENSGGNDSLGDSVTISSVSSNDIVFASLPTDLAVNDWIAMETKTPAIQLSEDLVGLLAARTVARIYESQTDTEALKNIGKRVKQLEEDILNVLTPRVEGEGKKVVSINNIKNWVS